MPRSRASDLIGVLKGAQLVTGAIGKHQEKVVRSIIKNSSLKVCAEKCLIDSRKTLNSIKPSKVPSDVTKEVKEVAERISTVQKV